jgi:hypothetical protein
LLAARTLPGEMMGADPSHADQQPRLSPRRNAEEPEVAAKRACREVQGATPRSDWRCDHGVTWRGPPAAMEAAERGCAAGPPREAALEQPPYPADDASEEEVNAYLEAVVAYNQGKAQQRRAAWAAAPDAEPEWDEEAAERRAQEDREKTERFMRAMTAGCPVDDEEHPGQTVFVKGMMSKYRGPNLGDGRGKDPWVPHQHQRTAAKLALHRDRLLLVHDAGLGKTYTAMLVAGGIWLKQGGKKDGNVHTKFVVSCPTACIDQWKAAVLDATKIPEDRVLATNKLDKITARSLAAARVVIVSKDLVRRAYQTCHERTAQHHQNERGNWCAGWTRREGSRMHPLFGIEPQLLIIDEVHHCRNADSTVTNAHALLSQLSVKVLGLSATPSVGKGDDPAGISLSMDIRGDADEHFQDPAAWFTDKGRKRVNKDYYRRWSQKDRFLNRVTDDVLDLPPLKKQCVAFDPGLPEDAIHEYNRVLVQAKRLRVWIQRNAARSTGRDVSKLMAYLTTLQQFLVSPMLGEQDTNEVKASPALIDEASRCQSGALLALREQIYELQVMGKNNVIVASNYTAPLVVAEAYVKREMPDAGQTFLYHGGLSQTQRGKVIRDFLTGSRGVLFLSIKAGGTGLHLVPGCNAMVFFGARPYSPAEELQCMKRIHRIGQTKVVYIRNLIAGRVPAGGGPPAGSVDAAIGLRHEDKQRLSGFVLDNDDSLVEEDGSWKLSLAGRMVDECWYMDADGTFNPGLVEGDVVDRIRAFDASAQFEAAEGGEPADLAGDEEGEEEDDEMGDAWLQQAVAQFNPNAAAAPPLPAAAGPLVQALGLGAVP